MKPRSVPCALTIAGSDSGGGAGIQADLKTFAALRVHGTSAITCVTAQNPNAVLGLEPLSAEMVAQQIRAVLSGFKPRAIKTGMLYSAEIIRSTVEALHASKAPVIVDPVMVSTSGATLLRPEAVAALKDLLLPRAALITPNLAEAELLLDRPIRSPEDLRGAARDLQATYRCAVLAKGGHLPGKEAIDFYYDGAVELLLEAPRVKGVSTHGTGCTYSAAIAGYCALGETLPHSVLQAKEFISNAIASSDKCGRFSILNPFWRYR